MTNKEMLYTLRAWFVHLYTSLGIIVGFFALYAISLKDAQSTFLLLGLACFIDSTDGVLARRWNVKKWAAEVDGRKLDDIVDFLNYTFIPIFFAHQFITDIWMPAVVFVLILSIYGFCRNVAKTDDGFFTGFPNFWNLLVFYLYLFAVPGNITSIILVIFAILILVPIKYISFSTIPLRLTTIIICIIYGILLLWIVIEFDKPNMGIVWVSLLGPLYYFVASIYLNVKKQYT